MLITANTSTSYVECDELTIVELVDFYNELVEYFERLNEERNNNTE